MSSDIWVGVGRAGHAAEARFTAQGVQVTTFSLAVDRGYGDKKKTVWLRVTCWRKLAEIAAQYVTKGKLLWVDGEIDVSCYQAKNGEHRASLELTARNVKFLGGKGGQGPAQSQDDVAPMVDEEEIPF